MRKLGVVQTYVLALVLTLAVTVVIWRAVPHAKGYGIHSLSEIPIAATLPFVLLLLAQKLIPANDSDQP